jgi:hypothetical protein
MKDKYLVRFDLIRCDGSILYGEQDFTHAVSEGQAISHIKFRKKKDGTVINPEAYNLADEYRLAV